MSFSLLIVNEAPIIRYAIKNIIEEHFAVNTVYLSDTPEKGWTILKESKVDILITDVVFSGIRNSNLTFRIKENWPDIKLLVFARIDEFIYSLEYLKTGADGFVHKNSEPLVIVKAVREVLANRKYASDVVLEQYLKGGKRAKKSVKELSLRETQVADLIAQGLELNEIALRLKLSVSTVSTYKTRVFSKLMVNNIAEFLLFHFKQQAG